MVYEKRLNSRVIRDSAAILMGMVLVTSGFEAPAEPIKVFLAGGQSNMRGSGNAANLPAELQGPQSDVLLVRGEQGTAGDTLMVLQPGEANTFGSRVGPEVTFGRTIADAFPDQNFAVLKYAAGGTALGGSWKPTTGASYQLFRQTVENGLTLLENAGYTPEIVGMIWHQGESNAGNTQAQYETLLNGFIADMRSHYGANLPFMIGAINADYSTEYATIAAAQMAVGAAAPYATFVPTDAGDFGNDEIHLTTAGVMKLGENFATMYQANYGNSIPEPSSLMLLGAAGMLLIRRRQHG